MSPIAVQGEVIEDDSDEFLGEVLEDDQTISTAPTRDGVKSGPDINLQSPYYL